MLFFGVGTGRCGTMTLANLLNAERGVRCLHEGKVRQGEEAGEQWLSFLTLQNLHAYFHPETAEALFRKHRGDMDKLRQQHALRCLGDIAYNYAPLVGVMPKILPAARLIVFFRDGRDFVRSAYAASGPDPAPVGWSPGRPADKVERFIALGRLRPRPSDPISGEWAAMSPVAKNAWLWAETNRLILAGLEAWPRHQVLTVRFEEFFADVVAGYSAVRQFLDIEGPLPPTTMEIVEQRINTRRDYPLPPWQSWDAATTTEFMAYARPVMEQLGYL